MQIQPEEALRFMEVSSSVSKDELTSSYRKLAFKYHPDTSILPNSTELFKQLTFYYNLLKDIVPLKVKPKPKQDDFFEKMKQKFKEKSEPKPAPKPSDSIWKTAQSTGNLYYRKDKNTYIIFKYKSGKQTGRFGIVVIKKIWNHVTDEADENKVFLKDIFKTQKEAAQFAETKYQLG